MPSTTHSHHASPRRPASAERSGSSVAVLYRMVMPGHICPYGLKAGYLLRRKGFEVEDHWLRTREETDAFKARHDVEATPQVFIDGRRIGGYDALRRHFGLNVREEGETSYRPVLAVFAVALLMAGAMLAASAGQALWSMDLLVAFVASSMCLLAMLKLQDLESFSTMFLNYDLLARRAVPYAYFYPFGELLAGVLCCRGSCCGWQCRWRHSSEPWARSRCSRRCMWKSVNCAAPVWAAAARCRWALCR